jgi:transposase
MARRTFQMIDVVEILQHWHAGRPKLVLAASLGVDPKTVRKYVAPAEAEGIRPNDGLVLDRAGWTAKVTGWFPELVDARARSSTWPMLEARRELITKMLETNTVATVHQRLRDEHDLRVSVTSLRRYVWQAFPDRRRRAAKPLRPLVPPGAEAQIDYGYLGRWLDPVGNRIRRVWAFVVVLACSRHMFLRPVLSMDQSSWVAAHTAAWEFFGGTPRRLVTDNLKTGVIKADLYDPKLNRAYAEMATHHDCLIDPARASKPLLTG